MKPHRITRRDLLKEVRKIPIDDLLQRYGAGAMSRREFIQRALALGLSLGMIETLVDAVRTPMSAATGGDLARTFKVAMQVTAPIRPPEESCASTSLPNEIVQPPTRFVEFRGFENRLDWSLRNAAQTQDPIEILTRSAVVFYWAHVAQPPDPTSRTPFFDDAFARALADLAVTGRNAFARFRAAPPDESQLVPAVQRWIAATWGMATAADQVTRLRQRSIVLHLVAAALRGEPSLRAQARPPLGWIAVSGEDDPPHRPVNVVSAPYPQYDIPVTVRTTVGTITVQVRFFIASRSAPTGGGAPPGRRSLPQEASPDVPAGDRVILFIHGHSSRAEEALDLIPWLHQAGQARGVQFSIVSLDLPNCGYSSMFDHTAVAPSNATTFPGGSSTTAPLTRRSSTSSRTLSLHSWTSLIAVRRSRIASPG